jgi:hypothetical protein
MNFCFGVICSVNIKVDLSCYSIGCKEGYDEALFIVATAVSFNLLNSVIYGFRGIDLDFVLRPDIGVFLD